MVVDICINAGPTWQTGTVFMMPKLYVNQRTISCKFTILKYALGCTSDKIE